MPFRESGTAHYRPPKVEIYQPTKNTMTYIAQFEIELLQKLEKGTQSTDEIVRWVSEKVLESYRNGIKHFIGK